jgi:tetratricopeptide (TPR) repeat protein
MGKIYARSARIEQASDFLQQISTRIIEGNRWDQAAFNILKGEIELSKANYAEAIDLFNLAYQLRDDNYPLESLAYGHLKKGDVDQAIARYELLISKKDLGWEAQEYWVKAHYQLAKIYEAKADHDRAIQFYERFLEIRKDADPGLPEVEDARKRLAALKE